MREKTKKLIVLAEEFSGLRKKLFGGDKFVVLDDKHLDTIRYNQLLQFFYPCYRTKDYVSPLKDVIIGVDVAKPGGDYSVINGVVVK